MHNRFIILFCLLILSACKDKTQSTLSEQATLADYTLGEKWVWKYKGVTTAGEVRSDGTDTREIVNFDGVLGMAIGRIPFHLLKLLNQRKA